MIPGLSKRIPPQRTRFGEPIKREGSRFGSLFVGPARLAVSPLLGSGKPQVDPLVEDLAQRGIKFGKRSTSLIVKGEDVLKPFGDADP